VGLYSNIRSTSVNSTAQKGVAGLTKGEVMASFEIICEGEGKNTTKVSHYGRLPAQNLNLEFLIGDRGGGGRFLSINPGFW
jgi:hypothetical protein